MLVELSALEQFADGVDHAEGICVTLSGDIYCGGEAGQLYRVERDGSFDEILSTGGFLLGLAADAAGLIYACDPGNACVWQIDPVSGRRRVFCGDAAGRPRLLNPNWGCFDAEGNYYFSDSGGWKERNGAIVVVHPGGAAEVWTAQSADFPNGIAVGPDGRSLVILESTPGAVVTYTPQSDGRAGPRKIVVELPGAVPDGVALAEDGSLVIACYRPDVIYRWHEGSGLEVLVADPEGTVIAAPTNVVFCGEALDSIIVPSFGRWHLSRFSLPWLRGVPLHYPTPEQLRG